MGLVAEVLIVAGANLEEKEKSGKSSLYLAARGGFVTLVDMIIKAERQVRRGGGVVAKEGGVLRLCSKLKINRRMGRLEIGWGCL